MCVDGPPIVDPMTTRRNALALLGAGAFAFRNDAWAGDSQRLALGRPHTDFIHSQNVPARVLGASNSLPGVSGAPLSYDAKGSRAVSVLFKFPSDWSLTRPHYVNSDQEFLVLEGSVEFDGVVYSQGDYAYLPAGTHHDLMRSADGATVLNFYEGEHLAIYEATPPGMFKPERSTPHVASNARPWVDAHDLGSTSLGAKVKEKILHHDNESGERTWLVRAEPDDDRVALHRPTVRNEAVEEMFVISGTISTPLGTMQAGAYAWRAPGTPRGPYGSRTGFTALLRSKGGSPRTRVVSRHSPVVWDAPLSPDVPASMREYAQSSLR